MPINPKALKHRRNQLRLTLQELADASKVDRQTIHRIETGARSTVRPRTVEKLAKALRCPIEDLQRDPGAASDVPSANFGLGSGGFPQISHRVDPSIKNAYWLVTERYGVSEADVVRLAPLLFTLVAEDSLATRRKRIDEWWEYLKKANEAACHLRHLPPGSVIATAWGEEADGAEDESIAAKDIFGDRVNNDENLSWRSLPEDYSAGTHNPFVAFLRDYAGRFAQVATVESIERGDAQYTLFEDRLRELACDDDSLADALSWGTVALHDIPEDLLGPARRGDRLAWLRSRVEEAKRLADEVLHELLPEPPMQPLRAAPSDSGESP
jgi:transcriptional regulator with XRE-family HTH domain